MAAAVRALRASRANDRPGTAPAQASSTLRAPGQSVMAASAVGNRGGAAARRRATRTQSFARSNTTPVRMYGARDQVKPPTPRASEQVADWYQHAFADRPHQAPVPRELSTDTQKMARDYQTARQRFRVMVQGSRGVDTSSRNTTHRVVRHNERVGRSDSDRSFLHDDLCRADACVPAPPQQTHCTRRARQVHSWMSPQREGRSQLGSTRR